MTYDEIVFITEDDDEYSNGYFVGKWDIEGEMFADPLLNLREVGALLEFIKESFPRGWMIIDDKVVETTRPKR